MPRAETRSTPWSTRSTQPTVAPEGIESTRIIVLANQARSKVTVAVRFPSEEAMKQGGAVLGAMNPPEGLTRASVDEYEVLLERTAS